MAELDTSEHLFWKFGPLLALSRTRPRNVSSGLTAHSTPTIGSEPTRDQKAIFDLDEMAVVRDEDG